MRITVISAAVVLLYAGTAQAAGFLLRVQGARASGRANAFVADPTDASAIYHNPAGLNNLDGLQFNVGGNVIVPDTQFVGLDGEITELDVDAIAAPFAYASYELSPYVTIGLGVNAPYGSGLDWPADSPGRQIVREIQLRTWFITPTVAVDFDQIGVPGLSFAAGLDLAPASAYLRQDIVFGDQVGQVELSGNDFGVGGRAGLMYNPDFLEELHVGVAYRLPVAYNFSGEGDFDIDDPALRQELPPDGDGSVELEVPQVLSVGVAYDILPELQVEVDVDYVGWSVYDDLVIGLPDGTDQVLSRQWDDTVVVRVGAEYATERWAIRGGYAYDPTPVPDSTLDFTLPDVDRNILTLGATFGFTENIEVDASFWYLIPGENDTAPEPFAPPVKGTYEVSAFVASLGINFLFDQPDAPLQEPAVEPEAPSATVEPVAGLAPMGGQMTASW